MVVAEVTSPSHAQRAASATSRSASNTACSISAPPGKRCTKPMAANTRPQPVHSKSNLPSSYACTGGYERRLRLGWRQDEVKTHDSSPFLVELSAVHLLM